MKYLSTRNSKIEVTAAEAITQGISADGGLFVPETLPRLTVERLRELSGKNYIERATNILAEFLDDFSEEEVLACAEGAYGGNKFADAKIAPTVKLNENTYMLELWHGPTCAFKDMALQMLPYLLTTSGQKTAEGKEIAILVATSGDTGKAALEGFRDVAGTRVMVFYPNEGVSRIQKLQMDTQEGKNVAVSAVYGNFDDAQSAVKEIFTDKGLGKRLGENNIIFSSANSINLGRLLPQIVYYVSAYCDMAAAGEIAFGEEINVAVPTGNFGNILAAYYAKHMGLPIKTLICASNRNNILTDFLSSGRYDRRRKFYTTSSPSMDILISSNLERLLYAACGESGTVSGLMGNLAADGFYNVSDEVRGKLQSEFFGGYCDEAETNATIRDTFENYGYLTDTHTAVGLHTRGEYAKITGDGTKTLVASTASPYKFAPAILTALTGKTDESDEFEQLKKLSELTKTQVPKQILELKNKEIRFGGVIEKKEMQDWICKYLEV